MCIRREIADVGQVIRYQALLGRPLRNARPQHGCEHLREQGQDVNPECHDRRPGLDHPDKCIDNDGATSSRAAPTVNYAFFSATTGAALGLPGLGSFNCLCSTPAFLSSDETVSDGIAPTPSQYVQRSSLATN